MGALNSKLSSEGEAMPIRLHPVLRRKLQEWRNRRHANLSKKQLLKDPVEEDDCSQPRSLNDEDRKSTFSSNEVVESEKVKKVLKEEPKVVAPPLLHESEKTKKEPEVQKDGKGEEEEEEKVVDKAVVVEEVVVVVKETMEEDEDEEEDDNEDNDSYVHMYPGSPSFRVYYIESIENKKKDSKEESIHKKSPMGDTAGSMLKKLPSEDTAESMHSREDTAETIASVNSKEGQETKTKRKPRRVRKFTRVIRKGNPVAVMNLLNVKSCYHPSCGSQDRARLLEKKAAT